MKRTRQALIVFLFLALCIAALRLPAQSPPGESSRGNRFSAEVFGGFLFFDPRDLNLRAAYDRGFLDNQLAFSNLYAPEPQRDTAVGEFLTIGSSLPFGFRMKVLMNKRWAVSLGFKYFIKDQESTVTARYPDYGARPMMTDYSFSPYSISASGFVPLLGVHSRLWKNRFFDLDLFVAGGGMFADCGYTVGVTRVYSRDGRAYRADETLYEIEGRSTGIAAEAGIHIKAVVFRSIRVFFEGGYAFQKAWNINGNGRLDYYRYTGTTSRWLSDRLEWEGYWGVKEALPLAPLPSNEWEKEDPRVRDFVLDLSGAFLRVGISYGFSL